MNALHPTASGARWLLAGATLIASAASAHVVLDYQAAPAARLEVLPVGGGAAHAH
jgi:hypothetical protein